MQLPTRRLLPLAARVQLKMCIMLMTQVNGTALGGVIPLADDLPKTIPRGAASTTALRHRYAIVLKGRVGRDALIGLQDRHRQKTLWVSRTTKIVAKQWSADGKAVALVDDRRFNRPVGFRLLLWREGRQLVTRDDVKPLKGFETVESITWSPDARYLMLHGALSMGESGTGSGDLWCFDVRRQRSRFVASLVTRWKWVSKHRLQIWTREVVQAPKSAARPIDRPRLVDCSKSASSSPDRPYPRGQ
jgi:hypothetical protein